MTTENKYTIGYDLGSENGDGKALVIRKVTEKGVSVVITLFDEQVDAFQSVIDSAITAERERVLSRIEMAGESCEDSFINLNVVVAMQNEIEAIRNESITN